jgi:hypothetical protein
MPKRETAAEAPEKGSGRLCAFCALFISVLSAGAVGAAFYMAESTIGELRELVHKSETQVATSKMENGHLMAQLSAMRQATTDLGARLTRAESGLAQLGRTEMPAAPRGKGKGGKAKDKQEESEEEGKETAAKKADAGEAEAEAASDGEEEGKGKGKGKGKRKRRRGKGRL